MCGIAGIIAWDEKYRVSRDLLLKMAAAIAHRGPDGEGIYLTRENEPITPGTPQVAFAFRRLAVLDPDPRAMQPMTIGHQTIVFNGEIYNFRELKAELSKRRPDYAWRTTGDAEVLLMSYQVLGEKCLEKLNGMFAFAVWDEREKSLFLARDRMGQKPLYVLKKHDGQHERQALAFASESGALRDFDRPAIDVAGYLRYGYVTHRQMAPGTWGKLQWRMEREDSYFSWSEKISAASIDNSRRLMKQAVTRQLVSDVPLGVLLSGGIDSSIIASCARECGPVDTFSIAFDDPRYDESPYAREVAKHLGTNHHEFRVTPNVIEDLPKLAAVFGEPFADSSAIPTHYLARETRKHVKVALSGDGGDELFGGYDRYRAIEMSRRLEKFVPEFAAARAGRFAGGHPKSRVTRAARLIKSLSLPLPHRYASYLRFFDDPLITDLTGTMREPDPIVRLFEQQMAEGQRPAEAAAAVDRITYLPDDLLTKTDRCSMLHGLEVRCPFMDHELVQFAAGLTTDQLLKGGPKRMLREAFAKDLPGFVFKRKKMGFAVPIGEWFRGPLRAMLRDHLFAADSFGRSHFNMKVVERLVEEHETERVDHSQRLYALLMLELWWKGQH